MVFGLSLETYTLVHVAQLTVMALFIVLAILAVRKFHEPVRAAGAGR